MTFSKGFLHILWRVLLLAVLALGLSYSLVKTEFVVTPAIFGLFILISIAELYWFLRRQERNWSRFLLSIEHHDFTRSYQQFQESKNLRDAYELITKAFEQVRRQQESDHLLLKTVLKHIPIGLACYSMEGEVTFANDPFLKLLGRKVAPSVTQLRKLVPGLVKNAFESGSGPVEMTEEYLSKRLLIKTESFTLMGFEYKLLSVMDVSHTLETHELESYQKLMRVMTHEIMNSTTPILSLIKVVNKKLVHSEGLHELSGKDQVNIGKSLHAIEQRTEGMLAFVEAYRKINKPIEPALETTSSEALVQGLTPLIDSIGTEIEIDDQLRGSLRIDLNLMSQVMINLVTNAVEAVHDMEQGRVRLKIFKKGENACLEVCDNGPGVKPENLHKIFIPFFTTKEKGSGIGLALSRRIVKAQGGNIEYLREGEWSCFRIRLNQP